MTALAKDTPRESAGKLFIAPQAVNAAVLYAGSFAAGGAIDNGTAANVGRVLPWTKAAGQIPLGFCEQPVTGTGSVANRAIINAHGRILNRVAVTGVSAATDVFRWVYLADDGTGFTLTRSGPSIPVGIITDWFSSTTCDVYIFGFGELLLMQAGGGARFTMFLGCVGAGHTGAGNALTGIPMLQKGKIQAFYGIVARAATDADVDLDFNLEIGGTNVTGGVLEWLFSDAIGVKKTATAITAANVFHEGDVLDVEVVVNTAGTAADPGLMNLYIDVLIDPGI
jgi:hypothetical protein